LLGGLIQPLFYVTPWMLTKVAWATATGQAAPTGIGLSAVIATLLWSVVFILVALAKFERMEY